MNIIVVVIGIISISVGLWLYEKIYDLKVDWRHRSWEPNGNDWKKDVSLILTGLVVVMVLAWLEILVTSFYPTASIMSFVGGFLWELFWDSELSTRIDKWIEANSRR